MTDHRRTKTPGLSGSLARFLSEESGAAKHDRMFVIGGVGIVAALMLVMWGWERFGATPEAAAAATPSASAPAAPKMVSQGPLPELDPSRTQNAGSGASQVFVASDYSETLSHGPDREARLLDDELSRVRAAEAAEAAAEAAADAAEAVAETVEETPETTDEGS